MTIRQFPRKTYLQVARPLKFLVDRSEEHTSELQSRFDLVCRPPSPPRHPLSLHDALPISHGGANQPICDVELPLPSTPSMKADAPPDVYLMPPGQWQEKYDDPPIPAKDVSPGCPSP